MSPIAYLTKTRMENARRLLLDADLTIKEVAAQVGYQDAHYFSRAFARESGMAPTAYRRKRLPRR